MDKCGFENKNEINLLDNFFECGTCGNHICKTQAEIWNRVCPHCFGRLYRIS